MINACTFLFDSIFLFSYSTKYNTSIISSVKVWHCKIFAENRRERRHQRRRVVIVVLLALQTPRLPRGQEQRPRREQDGDHHADRRPLRRHGDIRHLHIPLQVGAHGVGHGQHEQPEVFEHLNGAEEEGDQENAEDR